MLGFLIYNKMWYPFNTTDSDSEDEIYTVHYFIDDLASRNQELLNYHDFKGEIWNKYPNGEYDGDEIGVFYSEYKRERQKYSKIATDFLKRLINNDKTGVVKETVGKLFTLAAFRDRRYLVDENEIWNHYIEHQNKKNEEREREPIIFTPPKPPPKPKPKIQIDLTRIKGIIYDELVKTDLKLLNKNEFLNYLFNEHPQYTTESNKLYTQYKKDYKNYHKYKPVMPAVSPDMTLTFPFRSKIKDYEENIDKGIFPDTVKMTDEIPDKNSKRLKKIYSRPSFAYYPYSWEIDHLQYNRNRITYLFCLNINTRYLYVIPVNNKSAQETRTALTTLINKERENFNHPVNNIRGDGDKGFEVMKNYFPNINFYFTSSAFTYHNKLVDAVMKTLRNALNNDKLWDGNHDDIIQQLAYYYNFTKHRAIGMKPVDMHTNINKEWEYIRMMTERLNDVKRKQYEEGFFDYKPGDKLRIHLEYAKTNKKFDKRRRQFDRKGEFIRYVNGNVLIKLDGGRIEEVPIYYTGSLPQD
jgi:hypothetical protein